MVKLDKSELAGIESQVRDDVKRDCPSLLLPHQDALGDDLALICYTLTKKFNVDFSAMRKDRDLEYRNYTESEFKKRLAVRLQQIENDLVRGRVNLNLANERLTTTVNGKIVQLTKSYYEPILDRDGRTIDHIEFTPSELLDLKKMSMMPDSRRDKIAFIKELYRNFDNERVTYHISGKRNQGSKLVYIGFKFKVR